MPRPPSARLLTTPVYWDHFLAARETSQVSVVDLYSEARTVLLTGLCTSHSLQLAGTLPLWESLVPLLYAS